MLTLDVRYINFFIVVVIVVVDVFGWMERVYVFYIEKACRQHLEESPSIAEKKKFSISRFNFFLCLLLHLFFLLLPIFSYMLLFPFFLFSIVPFVLFYLNWMFLKSIAIFSRNDWYDVRGENVNLSIYSSFKLLLLLILKIVHLINKIHISVDYFFLSIIPIVDSVKKMP